MSASASIEYSLLAKHLSPLNSKIAPKDIRYIKCFLRSSSRPEPDQKSIPETFPPSGVQSKDNEAPEQLTTSSCHGIAN